MLAERVLQPLVPLQRKKKHPMSTDHCNAETGNLRVKIRYANFRCFYCTSDTGVVTTPKYWGSSSRKRLDGDTDSVTTEHL